MIFRTVEGSIIVSLGNGASMTKLLLSVTTGPALAFAMRRVALGEPRTLCNLRKT
jgi:hypothetical protein